MKTILLRFGEIYLKGNNRGYFEKLLISNIRERLVGIDFQFQRTQGRYMIYNFEEDKTNELMEKLSTVFGLYSISLADTVVADKDIILEYASKLKLKEKSFRVTVKRADKRFPINSSEFAAMVGEKVFENNPGIKVDLISPEKEIVVDIRENGKAYILTEKIKVAGGLPLGCSGRGLLLLSGGIDSPVAGYMMSKRGLKLDCLHFQSFPYTSIQAKEKVLSLAKIMKEYCGQLKIYMVSFTKVQEEIHKKCAPEFMITVMRRIMMRVAEKICQRGELGAIVTGESLGQVASQTMQSMTSTGDVVKELPLFRPLIGFDKEEVIKIAKKINTYETSILPYEDCCTVFLPKNPVIKPSLIKSRQEEAKLNVDELVNECLNSMEIIMI